MFYVKSLKYDLPISGHMQHRVILHRTISGSVCTTVDCYTVLVWAPSQYPKRRLIIRSREVSKPRDWYFELSYRLEIWHAHRQQCCRSACHISDNSKYKSRSFETSRDLTIRRLFGYWDGALVALGLSVGVSDITSNRLTSPFCDWLV